MNAYKLFPVLALLIAISNFSFAQVTKNESFKVSGNCGMCKNKIEKAAKEAGATYAVWDVDSKLLTIKYKSTSTNPAKIQQKIADAGYDTPKFRSTDESYNKLHGCCKYERSDTNKTCCDGEKCGKDEECCEGMDCCKDGKCVMMNEAQYDAKAGDCCKDGKCTKEGHNGQDCCKKS